MRKPWHLLAFYRHAIPCFRQASRALGNQSTSARRINGVFHTLTAWDCADDMRAFVYGGAHAKAIAAFDQIATGATFGFDTETLPDWEEVPKLWREHAASYDDPT